MNNFITTTKTKTKSKRLDDPSKNPFKGSSLPGFGNMASAWNDLMSAGQKVIDNRKGKNNG